MKFVKEELSDRMNKKAALINAAILLYVTSKRYLDKKSMILFISTATSALVV